MALSWIWLLALCSLAELGLAGSSAPPNPLLLVSIDGLRWDYPSKAPMRNLLKLAASGVRGLRLKGVFPTVTYPNHWTIVTGKTADKHGIIANNFYYAAYNKTFTMRSTEEMWWNTTLPIWATAKKQNRSVSAYGWPGCDTVINGFRPKDVIRLNRSASQSDMINTALGWFDGNNADMVALYFHEPDSTAHRTGSESDETLEKLSDMDDRIGYLWKQVEERGLSHRLNVVLLSDHGMTDLSASRIIRLTNWINMSDIVFGAAGTVVNLVPKEGNEHKVYNALKNVHPNMKVYWREEIPSKLMYKANDRIAPIVAIADEGWYIALNNSVNTVGVHGYDNDLDSMKSTFVAFGPDFKVGVNVTEVRSLDVYPLLCHLLGITPEENDGDFSKVSCMLKASPPCSASRSPLATYNQWLMAAVATFLLVCQ